MSNGVKSKRRDYITTVRLNEREYRRLQEMADELEVSVSDIIRLALRERYQAQTRAA